MSSKDQGLQQGLQQRHIVLMSLGCAIGVGLFLGSSSAIKIAGPGVILAYAIGGFFMYFIMRALGEMAVQDPTAGSFSQYARNYLGPAAGFTVGWNYTFSTIVFCMSEITAVAIYMKFWFPDVPQWIWALATFVIMIAINLLNVKFFGEFEYWFSMIKVAAIGFMIISGLGLIIFGIGNGGIAIGFDNLWNNGGFLPNGLSGVFLSLFLVMWSYGGMEMIAMTAAEVKNPEKTLKTAINNVFWRILIFYVGAMIVLLSVYPWTEIGSTGSPFVNMFTKLGIPAAAGIINFVVITAALSSFNSNTYGAVRILFNLANRGEAPSALARATKNGVPRNAVFFFAAILFLSVIGNYIVPEQIFMYFASIGTLSTFFTWTMILLSQIKFRKSLTADEVNRLAYKMPFASFMPYITLAVLAFIIVMLAYTSDTRIGVMVGVIWYALLVIIYYSKTKKKMQAEM
ncbi:amino acid permease [Brevibacillus sp. NRS-1366]|uniref:amino acid permease n=1 Tax=Brevibacillus sp. NRS-1366 TaxID=3233899 RepID=UPI003D25DEA2